MNKITRTLIATDGLDEIITALTVASKLKSIIDGNVKIVANYHHIISLSQDVDFFSCEETSEPEENELKFLVSSVRNYINKRHRVTAMLNEMGLIDEEEGIPQIRLNFSPPTKKSSTVFINASNKEGNQGINIESWEKIAKILTRKNINIANISKTPLTITGVHNEHAPIERTENILEFLQKANSYIGPADEIGFAAMAAGIKIFLIEGGVNIQNIAIKSHPHQEIYTLFGSCPTSSCLNFINRPEAYVPLFSTLNIRLTKDIKESLKHWCLHANNFFCQKLDEKSYKTIMENIY